MSKRIWASLLVAAFPYLVAAFTLLSFTEPFASEFGRLALALYVPFGFVAAYSYPGWYD